MGIGKRIKKYRLHKKLKGTELSKIINISQSALSEIENENTRPSSDTIISLVTNTDINPYWLLKGEGEIEEVSMSLKLDLLREIIQTVEELSREKKLSLQPPEKAKLIVFSFEELLENKTKKEDLEERVLRLMKLFSES